MLENLHGLDKVVDERAIASVGWSLYMYYSSHTLYCIADMFIMILVVVLISMLNAPVH